MSHQAVGGGISQFATTMFNAVFFSGLEDVYHKPHSYYISRYPAGREATVYEGQIDLQWRNDSDTGVYIDTAWTPGTITVTFYGTKRYEIESISSDRVQRPRSPWCRRSRTTATASRRPASQGFDITVTRVFRTSRRARRSGGRTSRPATPPSRSSAASPRRRRPTPTAPPGRHRPAALRPAAGARDRGSPAGPRPVGAAGRRRRARTCTLGG